MKPIPKKAKTTKALSACNPPNLSIEHVPKGNIKVYNDDSCGDTEIPCVVAKYSPKSSYIGAAYFDGYKGIIRIFNNTDKTLKSEYLLGKFDKNIYNCVVWRP